MRNKTIHTCSKNDKNSVIKEILYRSYVIGKKGIHL